MKHDIHVSLKRFVFSLSQALDLINPAMADHHKRVAYIALRVAETAGLTGRTKEDVVVSTIQAVPHLGAQRPLSPVLPSSMDTKSLPSSNTEIAETRRTQTKSGATEGLAPLCALCASAISASRAFAGDFSTLGIHAITRAPG